MFGFIWVSNVKEGLVVDNCIVEGVQEGINLTQTIDATIKNSTISAKNLVIRAGQSGAAVDGVANKITLVNNKLTSENDVIVLRGEAVDANLSMTKNAVSGTTHISGNTDKTTVSAEANYWNGKNQPIVNGAAVIVNEYYADEARTKLQRNKMGSIYAFVMSDRIFGDVTFNAKEGVVIKIVGADNNVIGTTTLEDTKYITGFNNKITWRINLGADDSNSWKMVWTNGAPSVTNLPAKVILEVDGEVVANAEVKFTANGDGASPVFAAKTDDKGKVFSFIACEGEYNLNNAANKLVSASAAGDNIAILTAGTYNVPTQKGLTITGAVDGVKFDMSKAVGINSNMTFNNVTFEYSSNKNYIGLQHAGEMVYNNCTFNGQVFLYGQSETFNECTFNQESSNAYNVWTYGAKQVAFKECTFNSAGKSVLIYAESASIFNNVTITGSTFNATQPVEGKAAIEMDASLTAGANVTITNSTATGFGTGNVSGNSLWNNKKGNANDANNDITVVVDGVTVLAPIYEAQIGDVKHRTLQEAINAAVKMTGDVTIEILAGTYANNIDLTNDAFGNSNARPNITFKPVQDAEVVLSGTVTLGYRQQNVGASMWNGMVTFDGITFDHAENGKHSLVIEDVKSVALTNCKVIGDGEYGIGSNSGNATTDATFTDCIFENGAMQVLGQLGAHLVVDRCVCNDFSFNVQAGATPGMTIKYTQFNMTLTDAHVGESFYAIRTNACPVNISNTTFNVDSEVSAVAADQTKWGLFWARKDANAKWNITDCKVNFTDDAMAQTELLLTKNDATTYANAKDRLVIIKLKSTSNDVEDLIKRGEGCATINGYRYLDGELDVTGMVAKIGMEVYATLEEAIAAVQEGQVIELVNDATMSYGAREAYKSVASTVVIDGCGKTLTLNQTNSDWSSFGLAAENGKLVLKNMTIEKTGYGDTSGAWNTHAIIFSCPVEMENVTVNNAVAVAADAALTNVIFNEANGYYSLWIEANGQTVSIKGGSMTATNGGRGIKIADQYINAPAKVTLSVDGTEFSTAKKAAVLVSSKAGADITAVNFNIENVAEDKVNFVWVDED